MKSGNLNFLEPSGSLQACNGTALSFVFYFAWVPVGVCDHIPVFPNLHGFDLHDFYINTVSCEVFELNFGDKTKYNAVGCPTKRTRLKLIEFCTF